MLYEKLKKNIFNLNYILYKKLKKSENKLIIVVLLLLNMYRIIKKVNKFYLNNLEIINILIKK